MQIRTVTSIKYLKNRSFDFTTDELQIFDKMPRGMQNKRRRDQCFFGLPVRKCRPEAQII
jgi:hypothetical protein